MIRLAVIDPGRSNTPKPSRRRFGLDTPLPTDAQVIERAILRHLATCHPDALVLALAPADDNGRKTPAGKTPAGRINLPSGVPKLLLLLPGGRAGFLVVKTQARALSPSERAFADLCRLLAVPVHVVRSLPEARRAFAQLGLASRLEG